MGFHSGFSGLVNSRVLFWKWVRVCVLVCLFVVRRGVLCRRWETVRDGVRERGEHIKRGWGLFLRDEYSNWHIYVITLLSMVIPLDLLSCKFQDVEMYKFFCFCLYPVTNLVSLSLSLFPPPSSCLSGVFGTTTIYHDVLSLTFQVRPSQLLRKLLLISEPNMRSGEAFTTFTSGVHWKLFFFFSFVQNVSFWNPTLLPRVQFSSNRQ